MTLRKKMRAVIGVVLVGGRYLAIKRSSKVRAPGKVCFPGGEIEQDESEPEALAREFEEELNVKAVALEKIWQSSAPSGTELNWWSARLEASSTNSGGDSTDSSFPFELSPNPWEVESVHWMTENELLSCEHLLASNRRFFEAVELGNVKPVSE